MAEDHIKILESNADEEINNKDHNKLESAKGEMGEAREENQRLKLLLARLVKDYESLQMNFFDILQREKQEEEATNKDASTSHDENEESELVSLSLGMSSFKGQPNMDDKKVSNEMREDAENLDKGLALGLDIGCDQTEGTNNNPAGTESSFDDEGKEEEPSEIWPPSKVLKTMRSGDERSAASQSQHIQLKKARVSIRARCDTQTINDGCQWRKYGQKIAKGNPCPRAYYRCTVSPSCPVRKQVQRCAEDMSILITTYEGTHNHPLPISATAMASTTSAAASMLQSPSMTSQQGLATNSNIAPIINFDASYNNDPTALNFSTCQISRPPHQFYFPNSCISTSNFHPTITLDLTAPPTPQFGKFTPNFSHTPKYNPSTNLNFASSTFSPLQSSMPQSHWSNTYSGYFNHSGTTLMTQNRNNQQGGSISGKQPLFQEHLHQPNYYMSNHHNISQQSLPDSITKAITTNPKFQSALAAALTTYVGSNGSNGGGRVRENNHGGFESVAALNLNLGGDHNGKGRASSSQQGNLITFPSAASKSASG